MWALSYGEKWWIGVHVIENIQTWQNEKGGSVLRKIVKVSEQIFDENH